MRLLPPPVQSSSPQHPTTRPAARNGTADWAERQTTGRVVQSDPLEWRLLRFRDKPRRWLPRPVGLSFGRARPEDEAGGGAI